MRKMRTLRETMTIKTSLLRPKALAVEEVLTTINYLAISENKKTASMGGFFMFVI